MTRTLLDTDQKALEINLDETIYGTFAEIGAGQEVARYFFKAGAAAGTIAKTMSAYDKVYSDQIYGAEVSGRYVCESRIYKMLDHEYELMETRLADHRPNTRFFVFADSVSAINYSKTIKGHGWMGVRFQVSSDGPANDMLLHVRMLDNTAHLQQQAVGRLGVNMVYACFHYLNDLDAFVDSLMDGVKGRVIVDMIHLEGPDLEHVDDRALALKMVRFGLSTIAIFDEKGKAAHVSEFLYKKSVMAVRGHYNPPTLVSLDVFKTSYTQFCDDISCDIDKTHILAELTLDTLSDENGFVDEADFLQRADFLNALGHYVVVSNYAKHDTLINYLKDYRVKEVGLLIGVRELKDVIASKFEKNVEGALLSAMGELFSKNIRIYAYPAFGENGEIITAGTMPVPEGIKFLYKYLLDSQHIVEVKDYDESLLNIFGWKVKELIKKGDDAWKQLVPQEVAELIEKNGLYGAPKLASKEN